MGYSTTLFCVIFTLLLSSLVAGVPAHAETSYGSVSAQGVASLPRLSSGRHPAETAASHAQQQVASWTHTLVSALYDPQAAAFEWLGLRRHANHRSRGTGSESSSSLRGWESPGPAHGGEAVFLLQKRAAKVKQLSAKLLRDEAVQAAQRRRQAGQAPPSPREAAVDQAFPEVFFDRSQEAQVESKTMAPLSIGFTHAEYVVAGDVELNPSPGVNVSVRCHQCDGRVSVFFFTWPGETADQYVDYLPVQTTLVWNTTDPPVQTVFVPLLARGLEFTGEKRVFQVALADARSVGSIATPQVVNETALVTVTPGLFCGRGVIRNATRDVYQCTEAEGEISAGVYSSRTSMPANTTCPGALAFFNFSQSTTLPNATAEAIVDAHCESVLTNPNTSASVMNETRRWCAAFRACVWRAQCTFRVESRRVCLCPLDRKGRNCESQVQDSCDAQLVDPPAHRCTRSSSRDEILANLEAQTDDSRLLARARRYDPKLDGEPPCVVAKGVMPVKFNASCAFDESVTEGPDPAWDVSTAAGWNWTAFDFASTYVLLLPDRSFAVSPGPVGLPRNAALPSLSFRFFNLHWLSDESQVYGGLLTLDVLAGRAHVEAEVNVDAFKDEFQAGGRLYMEYVVEVGRTEDPWYEWLWGDSRDARIARRKSDVRHQNFEIEGYKLKPPPPAELSTAWIVGIVFICLGVLGVCAGGFLWMRRRERRKYAQHAEYERARQEELSASAADEDE